MRPDRQTEGRQTDSQTNRQSDTNKQKSEQARKQTNERAMWLLPPTQEFGFLMASIFVFFCLFVLHLCGPQHGPFSRSPGRQGSALVCIGGVMTLRVGQI